MTTLRSTGAALVALSTLIPLSASAQYINSGPSTSRVVRYSPQGSFNEQPLVTNKQDLSVFVGPLAAPKFGTNEEAGIHAIRLPFEAFGDEDGDGGQLAWFFQLGAAYGITKGFEAGFFIPPLLLAPESGSGDLPIFVTWASSIDNFDVGLRNTLTIPLRDTSLFRWNPGVHALVRLASGRFEVGAFFPMIFPDEGGEVFASLDVPVRAFFGLNEQTFVGVETGLKKLDIANGENDLFLPLGASAVYSIEAGEHRVDLTAKFLWQSFVWINAPEDWPDRVLQDTFTISFGANMLFDVQDFAGGSKDDAPARERPTATEPPDDVDNPPDVQGRPPGVTSDGPAKPAPQCVYNEDCKDGRICQNAQCILPGRPAPECTYNDDCNGSQVCQNAQCVDPGAQP